ncbi:MAG TPA: methionyl-tRNA formyltransferase [Candidatus Woesebacteria bacterium]|nr:methionyl-tRNA formyltransferase [Candidatus Woesebacteria bacterium]
MVKIIFFGSSEYSVIILKQLLQIPDFKVQAVFTKPDKAVGRQQIITANPVSAFAKTNHLPLFQPEEFDSNLQSTISNLHPDLGLVVAYGPPYFTQDMIDIPPYKIVNIHPSPLPQYRGATPGPWQIINGETTSAVTFFQIDAFPDHGPIITQIPFDISPDATATDFYHQAFTLAAQNLETTIKSYLKHPKSLTPQDHAQKSYFPKFTKDTAKIDWSWDPVKLERFVRALNPWPVAWTEVINHQNKIIKMKLFSATVSQNQLIPQLVQIEGKKPVSWSEISSHYIIKTA